VVAVVKELVRNITINVVWFSGVAADAAADASDASAPVVMIIVCCCVLCVVCVSLVSHEDRSDFVVSDPRGAKRRRLSAKRKASLRVASLVAFVVCSSLTCCSSLLGPHHC